MAKMYEMSVEWNLCNSDMYDIRLLLILQMKILANRD